jgi:hypothetical protein
MMAGLCGPRGAIVIVPCFPQPRFTIRGTYPLVIAALVATFSDAAHAQDQEGVLIPPFAPGVADFHQGGHRIGVGPPLQFSDDYYAQNGIDAVEIRAQAAEVPAGPPFNAGFSLPGQGPWVEYQTGDPRFANVAGTGTGARQRVFNMGYNAAGEKLFYPDPPAFFFESAFLTEEARMIADRSRVFIFPRQKVPQRTAVGAMFPDGSLGNPFFCPGLDNPDRFEELYGPGDPEEVFPFNDFNPAPCNRRQDNLFDTGLGYLTSNPLALWRLVSVTYDGPDVDDPECVALMDALAARNGFDEDGTPLIKTTAEVRDLEYTPAADPTVPGGVPNPGGKRCVTLKPRPTHNANGPASPTNPIEGPPWVV